MGDQDRDMWGPGQGHGDTGTTQGHGGTTFRRGIWECWDKERDKRHVMGQHHDEGQGDAYVYMGPGSGAGRGDMGEQGWGRGR